MKTAHVFSLNRLVFVLISAPLMLPLGCGNDSSSVPAETRSSTGDTETTETTFTNTPIETDTETPVPTPTGTPTSTETPLPPAEAPPPSATMVDPTCSPETVPTSPPAATPDACSRRCLSDCTLIYDPVCGTDGCTYGNSCEAQCVGVAIARSGPCDAEPATPTPTPMRPAEPTPEPITFPGCENVAAESHYCLTLSGGEVTLLGLDTGDVCTATVTDAPVGFFLPGGSIAWQDENLYACGEDGLIRISLRDGSWEVGGTPCLAVASYDGGLLVNRWLLPFLDSEQLLPWFESPLSWYPNYEAVLNDEPGRTFDLGTFSATMTVQGDRLYTAWHAGISIDVADLNKNRALGVLTLEDYNGWMLGMSVTEDGYLVLSGDPWGAAVYVFDAYDGRLLDRIDLGITPSGLACVAGGEVTPRDTPTATPTPTFNPAQESTPTPCTNWLNCPDPCSEMQPEPSPFQLYELPPSIPIEGNCLDGGYTSSNYVVPDDLLVADASEELHVIGAYEGRGNPGFRPNPQGVVEVVVHERPKPVVLALSSFGGMQWRITLDPAARLSRVILQGYEKQEVEGVPAGVPVLERRPEQSCGFAYGWEVQNGGGSEYTAMIASLRRFTGLVETSFQGCYSANRFEIPYWSGEPPTGAPTPVPGDESMPREDRWSGVVAPASGD